ncbi:hypothetical protein D3C80_1349590 [compost metagenome]
MGAFAKGHRTGCVRATAFAGGIQVVVGDAGTAQLQHVGLRGGRGDAEVPAAGEPQLQAAAGQGGLHGLLGALLADHRGRLLATHPLRFEGDDVAALARDPVKGGSQAGGRQVERQGLHLGMGVEAGQGDDEGQGAGPEVEHRILPNEVACQEIGGTRNENRTRLRMIFTNIFIYCARGRSSSATGHSARR